MTLPKTGSGNAVSYGRGGAGNISRNGLTPDATPQTPTIKSSTYTTGRGGTGNMAHNDPLHPELARKLQDVDPSPRRFSEGESHFGRGEQLTPSK